MVILKTQSTNYIHFSIRKDTVEENPRIFAIVKSDETRTNKIKTQNIN